MEVISLRSLQPNHKQLSILRVLREIKIRSRAGHIVVDATNTEQADNTISVLAPSLLALFTLAGRDKHGLVPRAVKIILSSSIGCAITFGHVEILLTSET